MPHTTGPASSTPITISGQCSPSDCPDETTPHMKAHIGGNQVMGFSSSSTVAGAGCRSVVMSGLTLMCQLNTTLRVGGSGFWPAAPVARWRDRVALTGVSAS